MKLLCVILNFRTPDLTLWALDAARTALEKIPDHRIDIVDNDSGDGSFEKIKAAVDAAGYPDVEVIASPRNGGFGAGNNVAIRSALSSDDPPEYVYILNSDAAPAPDAVKALLDLLETHPGVGIAGSYIHGTDNEPHLTAFRFPSVQSELIGSARLGLLGRLWPDKDVAIQPMPSSTRSVDWLAGASMMIRSEVLRQVGLFDETFFLYFEETDLCRRARGAGWDIKYVVESRVAHVGSASTGMKDKQRRMPTYWFDSRRHYLRKNHGRSFAWAANIVQAAGLASFALRARIQNKEDPHPVGYLEDFVRYNFFTNRP